MSLVARWKARFAAARRGELYGINRRNVELVYRENARKDYPIADDKLLCKQHLAAAGVPVSDTVVVCDGLYAIPQVLAQLDDAQGFVIKPANGSGGDGILVVGDRVAPGVWRRAGGELIDRRGLHRHLAEIVLGAHSAMLADRAFVERRIRPHAVLHGLWADGLCDIRVITHRARPVMAMIRVPTHESQGRANLHQGGLGLAIDLATGKTMRAVHRGRAIANHPEGGAPLLGIQVPSWDGVLDVARRAAGAVPLGYLGCDVVVDEHRGPLILEINARPGLEIQNVHGYGLGRALAEAR